MPYCNRCKKCNHEWETEKVDSVCPNCGATGAGTIGFSYYEEAQSPAATDSADTLTEPEPKSVSLDASSNLELDNSAEVPLDVKKKEE